MYVYNFYFVLAVDPTSRATRAVPCGRACMPPLIRWKSSTLRVLPLQFTSESSTEFYLESCLCSWDKSNVLTLIHCIFFYRSMPISPNNSNHKRDSQMSKMVTTVPPCNPFNLINKLEEVLESKVQWTVTIKGHLMSKVTYVQYSLWCSMSDLWNKGLCFFSA
jgi:hypothetical protein